MLCTYVAYMKTHIDQYHSKASCIYCHNFY